MEILSLRIQNNDRSHLRTQSTVRPAALSVLLMLRRPNELTKGGA
jgi:hypothetical protein